MESHLHEWLHLLLRWIHFIVGTAWIGASFYFNWLENNLDRRVKPGDGDDGDGIAGRLWAIHGGGFYHLKKYRTGPAELPAALHWFKWEAYATWASGFALLVVVYYFNARLFLLAPAADLSPQLGIAVGVAAVLGSWFAYHGLCCSPLRRAPAWLAAAIFGGLVILAWALSAVFSGRGAYMHIGAAMGTMMVGNVFFVIIPAQQEMVAALAEKRRPDPRHGQNGLLRSRHNNYLTLPVLFIMVSAHFPSTYGHAWNWAILAAISIAGWLARHYFNARHASRAAVFLLPAAFALMLALAWVTTPGGTKLSAQSALESSSQSSQSSAPSAAPDDAPVGEQVNAGKVASVDIVATIDTAQIAPIIQSRCVGCHAKAPAQPGFSAPPAGLALESTAAMELHAARIFTATTVTKTMPLGNITAMTEAERRLIAAWYHALTAASGE